MAEAMEQKTIDLRVIAPTMATAKDPYKFKQNVDMVIMRATTGDMGILPGRMPISATLDSGVMRIFDQDGERERNMVILGGVVHSADNIVTILSDAAFLPGEINIESVTAELKELQRQADQSEDFAEKNALRKKISSLQVQVEFAGR